MSLDASVIRNTNIYGLGVEIRTVSKLYGGGGDEDLLVERRIQCI